MIEPKKEAYGREADVSYFGDYLELLALAEKPLRRADLADYFDNLGWYNRVRELFHNVGEVEDEGGGGTEDSAAEQQASRVFDLLSERAEILGDAYPFELDNVSLRRKDPLLPAHDGYLDLLTLTIAHHHSLDTAHSPTDVFEVAVAQAMTARGLTTANMGEVGRRAADFRAALEEAGDAINLLAAPEARQSREHAQEAGVDTLSHFEWGDTRPGHWVFLGQATVGKSGSWQNKITEPHPTDWGPWMSSLVQPVAYLAVPHHVETFHIRELCGSHSRMVLDRLRLSRYISGADTDIKAIRDVVLGEEVFHPVIDG